MGFWETVLQIVILILALRALHMVSAGNTCSEVRRNFMARGGPSKMVPFHPYQAKDLRTCPNNQLSCCNRQMEDRFQSTSKRELKEFLKMKTSSLKFNFRSFAEKYQGDIVDTFSLSGNHTRDVVKRLLRKKIGSHRLRASLHEVDQLFHSLGLQVTAEEVKSAFDRFADKLFLLLVDEEHNTSQPDIPYAKCVAEQRFELHPFMDVPNISAVNLTTAIELARTLHEGLAAGAIAVNATEDARFSQSCQHSLFKIQYCSYCPGLTLLKPCIGVCKNVLRGCFAGVTELDQYWNYYVSSLVDVTERMRSSESKFNLEIALEDFQNKLSTSLSVILENITKLRDTVETQCKNTRTLKRSKRNSELTTESDGGKDGGKPDEKPRGRHGGSGRRKTRNGRRKNGRNNNYDAIRQGFNQALRGLEEEDPFDESPPEPPEVLPPHEVLFHPPKRVWPRKAGEKAVVESKKASSQLHKRIGRFIDSLNSSINFYRQLPDSMCGEESGMGIEVSRESNCWDGADVVTRYEKEVVPAGYGKQASNPEVKVLKVDKEIIRAIESLRVATKILLAESGKNEVPGILLHAPVYEKREDEKNLPKNKTPKFPCDDEDDCDNNEGSGSKNEFNSDSLGQKNQDEIPETDIKISIGETFPPKGTGISGPPTDDVYIEVTTEEENNNNKKVRCKGGRKKCRRKSTKATTKRTTTRKTTTSKTMSTTSSAFGIFKLNLVVWFLWMLASKLTLWNVIVPN